MVRLLEYTAKEITPKLQDWICIVGHGGADKIWSENHTAVKYLFNYFPIIYSLELPAHGKSTTVAKPATEALKEVREILEPKVKSRKVCFVSYSLSSFFFYKLLILWKENKYIDPYSLCISIGCGLNCDTNEAGVRWFWKTETFKNLGKDVLLKNVHGENWSSTLESCRNWMFQESDNLFPNEAERQVICSEKERIHFIIGTREQAFAISDIAFAMESKASAKKNNSGTFRSFHLLYYFLESCNECNRYHFIS